MKRFFFFFDANYEEVIIYPMEKCICAVVHENNS
jgi:hypothetical protein